MNSYRYRRGPATLLEQARLALNAAIVMRDVSFLRSPGGAVRHGCRSAMRQHALTWRNPRLTAGTRV